MLIDLTKSTIFTKDPGIRFAKEHALDKSVWPEVWRRYKLLDYSNGDLRDYLFVKHGRNLAFNTMTRWLLCGEIYMRAKPFLDKGVTTVNTVIFRDLEQQVIDELTKQVRWGRSVKPKTII